ncbi:MAG TPA: nucleotide disphospho-sugar-binding domain-containing protein, partial [Puia sp.]|nr:nucleotide disphospho-sugar-binding domain-containing protein [Puia sp.]
ALRDEPLSVIVVSDPALFATWPPNFMVRSRVPQLELLPYLEAVVCHAGHNTVCESLIHGLPLVVVPIAYDQSHVASRVTSTESGIRLNFKRFKAAHLKQAVRDVLGDARYRDAARRIQASFAKAGGAERAAGLLEKLAAGAGMKGIGVREAGIERGMREDGMKEAEVREAGIERGMCEAGMKEDGMEGVGMREAGMQTI